MFKTIGFGKIDTHGLKRILVHALLIGLAGIVTYIETLVMGHTFSDVNLGILVIPSTAVTAAVLGINNQVLIILEKWFGSYDVVLNVPES